MKENDQEQPTFWEKEKLAIEKVAGLVEFVSISAASIVALQAACQAVGIPIPPQGLEASAAIAAITGIPLFKYAIDALRHPSKDDISELKQMIREQSPGDNPQLDAKQSSEIMQNLGKAAQELSDLTTNILRANSDKDTEILTQLVELQSKLNDIAHPDKNTIEKLDEFTQTQPTLFRRILDEQFDTFGQRLDKRFDTLETLIEEKARQGINIPREHVFDVPKNDFFVKRDKETQGVINALIEQEPPVTLTIHGTGGAGKTTLAKEVCHSKQIQEAFENIIFVEISDHPEDKDADKKTIGLKKIYHDLTEPGRREYETVGELQEAVRDLLQGHKSLIVLDDVWDSSDLKPFSSLGNNVSLLITTRDDVTATWSNEAVSLSEMSPEQSIQLLLHETTIPYQKYKRIIDEITRDLTYWPLTLMLVNKYLVKKTDGITDQHIISDILNSIHQNLQQSIAYFDKSTSDRDKSITASLELSLSLLTPEEQIKARLLGETVEGFSIPIDFLSLLWNLEAKETEKLVQKLGNISLVDASYVLCEKPVPIISLHEIIRLTFRNTAPNAPIIHHKILDFIERQGFRLPDDDALKDYCFCSYYFHKSISLTGSLMEKHVVPAIFRSYQSAISPDGKTALFTNEVVRNNQKMNYFIFIGENKRTTQRYECQGDSPIAASPNGYFFILHTANNRFMKINTKFGEYRKPSGLYMKGVQLGTVEHIYTSEPVGTPRCLAISPDTKHVYAGTYEGQIKKINLRTGKVETLESQHEYPIATFAFSQDSQYLYSVDDIGHIEIWQISTGECISNIYLQTKEEYSKKELIFFLQNSQIIDIGPDYEIAIAMGMDIGILWKKNNDNKRMRIKMNAVATSVYWNTDQTLLVGFHDGSIVELGIDFDNLSSYISKPIFSAPDGTGILRIQVCDSKKDEIAVTTASARHIFKI